MAIAYNKVVLVGRLTRDPEIRSTVNGSTVANFSLAVNRQGKNDNTDFIRIVAFGKQAEFASNYLSKGQLILVEGSLHINKWTDKNDIRRETAEVWASQMTFMESKRAQQENNNNMDIQVEDSYKKPTIKSIDDSNDLPDFDDPFSDLEGDLSSDENPF